MAALRIVGGLVAKPWHHRREAEGGRVMALGSPVVSKSGLHRRRVGGGQIATGTTEKLHHAILDALEPKAEFTIKMWVTMSPAERTFAARRTVVPPQVAWRQGVHTNATTRPKQDSGRRDLTNWTRGRDKSRSPLPQIRQSGPTEVRDCEPLAGLRLLR